MGLAAAHGLLEAENALVAPAHQPIEYLPKQHSHALGDMRFGKERSRIEGRQVGDFRDRITTPSPKR
jgi:hypothetical protein